MRIKSVLLLSALMCFGPNAKAAERPEIFKRFKTVSALGIRVVYPQSVPSRFSSVSISTSSQHFGDGKVLYDYDLRFCDKDELCIQVRSGSDGIGDIFPVGNPDRLLKGVSKLFGQFEFLVLNPHTEFNDKNSPSYMTQWMETKTDHEPHENGAWTFTFAASGVTDKEALEIVKSARVAK